MDIELIILIALMVLFCASVLGAGMYATQENPSDKSRKRMTTWIAMLVFWGLTSIAWAAYIAPEPWAPEPVESRRCECCDQIIK